MKKRLPARTGVCMFAYLVGKIADISEDNLVLEVNHIGFNIKIPSSLHSSLPGIGEEIKNTYLYLRQGGFLSAVRISYKG